MTLLGIGASALVAKSFIDDTHQPIRENFINVPMEGVADRVSVGSNGAQNLLRTDYQSMMKSPSQITSNALRNFCPNNQEHTLKMPQFVQEPFTQTPNTLESFYGTKNFQGMLSPRFDPNGYTGNIKYNMPSQDRMGAPKHPLDFGADGNSRDMSQGCLTGRQQQMFDGTKEGYTSCNKDGSGGMPSCGSACGGSPNTTVAVGNSMNSQAPSNVSAFQNAINSINKHNGVPVMADMLPAGDMTTINDAGKQQQVYVYDRFMFANQRSRLAKHADPIRGDLFIAPNSVSPTQAWGVPSVRPNIDLRTGSLAMIGGIQNETAQQLSEAKALASGGASTAKSYAYNYSLNSPNTTGGNLQGLNLAQSYTGSVGDGALQFTSFL